jgi:hypothetical protein
MKAEKLAIWPWLVCQYTFHLPWNSSKNSKKKIDLTLMFTFTFLNSILTYKRK